MITKKSFLSEECKLVRKSAVESYAGRVAADDAYHALFEQKIGEKVGEQVYVPRSCTGAWIPKKYVYPVLCALASLKSECNPGEQESCPAKMVIAQCRHSVKDFEARLEALRSLDPSQIKIDDEHGEASYCLER